MIGLVGFNSRLYELLKFTAYISVLLLVRVLFYVKMAHGETREKREILFACQLN
jgi:ABC-type arginine transport system permease subunit